MEKQDTRRLFSLIETIYPNAKQQSRTAAAPPMNSSGGFEEIQDDGELPF